MSLLQKIIIQKHINELNQEKLLNAWKTFEACFLNPEKQANIAQSKEEQYQEGFLRDLFVDVLGYTLNPEPSYNLTTELKNIANSKKVDGAILKDIGNEANCAIAVIELKGMNTTDLEKIQAQAFGYKNNQPHCRYVMTSNFQKLRFYIDNAVNFIEWDLFTLSKEEFAEVYLLLNKDSLLNDLPATLQASSLSQEERITKQLYQDYASFKRALFADLTALNPEYDALELFKKSQKLLDRLLFIFFAEDSHLLPANFAKNIIIEWEKLKALKMPVPLYERIKQYFDYLNTGYKDDNTDIFAYNGGLFKPDDLLNNLKISDEVLYPHIKKLSEYDFASEVDVNILGHIFENSLNEIDEVRAQLAGEQVDKGKTKRKKDGVFYTPKYITKYIVENTVGKLCTNKKIELGIEDDNFYKPQRLTAKAKTQLATQAKLLEDYRAWLLQLTICDPACGSGAFLNESLNFLIAEHAYIDELTAKLYGDSIVFTDIENSILENNLFGVDINEESVEIAKLSLWLRTAQPERKLNSLNNNIKCGNSLIADPAVAGDLAFDWQAEFPQVFDESKESGGGFDVVIGNPPYVKEYTAKSAFDGLRDKDCYQGKMDLWYFFGDLAIDIVKPEKGLIGYIAPNNWITNSGASNFRNIVLEKARLMEFIDFGDFKVFESAGIQTMIYIMRNSVSNDEYKLNYSRIINKDVNDNEVIDFLNQRKSDKFEYFQAGITKKKLFDKTIHFTNNEIFEVITKIKKNDYFQLEKDEIAQGIVAPQDYLNRKNVDILGDDFKVGQGVFNLTNTQYSDMNLSKIEKQLVKPFYTSNELAKYYGNKNNENWVIYTSSNYKKENSLNNYPKIKSHLDKFQEVITSSNKPYGLHRARDENFFKGEKILSVRKCSEPTFTYVDFDSYVSQTYYSIKTDKIPLKELTVLLNSQLIKFWLRNQGKMQGDIFQIDKEPLLNIPLKKPNRNNSFAGYCDKMLSLNQELQTISVKFLNMLSLQLGINEPNKKLQSWYELSDKDFFNELEKDRKKAFKAKAGTTKGFEKLKLVDIAQWEDYFLEEQQKAQAIQSQITQTDAEIDRMVYELYGLTEEEILIVEAS